MRSRHLIVLNYFLFLVLTLFLLSLLKPIWSQLLQGIPLPQLWIVTLAYWVMARRLMEGIIMTYLLSFLVASLTVMSLSMVLLINMLLFGGGLLIKRNVFWPGPSYLMFLAGLQALSFPFVHFGVSWIFESNPMRFPAVFQWALACGLTALFSRFLFFVFRAFDILTSKESPPELRLDKL